MSPLWRLKAQKNFCLSFTRIQEKIHFQICNKGRDNLLPSQNFNFVLWETFIVDGSMKEYAYIMLPCCLQGHRLNISSVLDFIIIQISLLSYLVTSTILIRYDTMIYINHIPTFLPLNIFPLSSLLQTATIYFQFSSNP